MGIVVENVSKNFGDFVALENVSLEVPSGSLTALLGPSGGGKSTLLRVIAGLEEPDSGTVILDGQDLTKSPARERGVGFVFQHYAAFKHMTVRDNVAYGLKIRKRPKDEIASRVEELLGLVHLDGFAHRYPAQLSGGQRQRMALARALAVEPKVMLLDEPFGALDAKVRLELRRWLRRLHDELHITSIFVTHDQEEAMEVADRVVVMNHGAIEQVGTPEEIYEHPATPFVYDFIGQVNLFHGRVHEGHVDLGGIAVEAPEHRETRNTPAIGYVRPHDLEVARPTDPVPSPRTVTARVRHIHPVGPVVRLEMYREDTDEVIEAHITREQHRAMALRTGETVQVSPKRLQVFVQPSGTAVD